MLKFRFGLLGRGFGLRLRNFRALCRGFSLQAEGESFRGRLQGLGLGVQGFRFALCAA